ncbi:MAG: VWA domain-containing protein [Bryobacterales bacterium]|nr:VWA domain-containing protein [Bryobacterales bacterium]
MVFEHPWVLLLLLPLAGWVWFESRQGKRIPHLLLRSLVFALILLALASPVWELPDSTVRVVALADVSESVGEAGMARERQILSALEAEGGSSLRVIPFGSRPLDARGVLLPDATTLRDVSRGTNLEASVRYGLASLPARAVPRIVLISDGLENKGSLLRAAWQARSLGVPIEVFPLAGRSEPELAIRSLVFPPRVFTGERFPVQLVVESPAALRGRIEITVDGQRIGQSDVDLRAGENEFHLSLNVASEGVSELRATVSAAGSGQSGGEAQQSGAITFRSPAALFVSSASQQEDANLLQVLNQAKYKLKVSPTVPENLRGLQLLVLNNQDLEKYSELVKKRIEDYVLAGGGLLVVSGDHNIYVEKPPGTPEDALTRALPAKLAPPQSEEGTLVTLVFDKSSSMEGTKMQLARVAAIGVIDNLRPQDLVGVLTFDNSYQWTVPIRKAEAKSLIKRLISGIMPDGGTQIAPALEEAYRKVQPMKASYKHIVLLTDGISEEGDSLNLAKEAALNKVTISTVGLGRDVNRNYLQKVAENAKGSAYIVEDPTMLQQILLKDVMEHTGSTAIEGSVGIHVARETEVTEGIDFTKAPKLKGFVKYETKPSADLLLSLDREDAPLLARWQYGLGRAAVFTSDANGRWAADWLSWEGYDKFWANLVRDLLPRSSPRESSIRYDEARNLLLAEYRIEPGRGRIQAPELYVFGPDGYRQPLRAEAVSPGLYRVEAPTGDHRGLFRVRPLAESEDFPELGYYIEEPEVHDHGNNERLLQQVAAYTGGRVNPSASQVFDPGNVRVESHTALWPFLIAAAVILQLLELFLRKGMPWLRERQALRRAGMAEV